AREPVAQGHAVAEADEAEGVRWLLQRMMAVAEAVAVEVLGRPAHRLRLHDVEVALPLRRPVQAACVVEEARRGGLLEPPREAFGGGGHQDGDGEAQREVDEPPAHPAIVEDRWAPRQLTAPPGPSYGRGRCRASS